MSPPALKDVLVPTPSNVSISLTPQCLRAVSHAPPPLLQYNPCPLFFPPETSTWPNLGHRQLRSFGPPALCSGTLLLIFENTLCVSQDRATAHLTAPKLSWRCDVPKVPSLGLSGVMVLSAVKSRPQGANVENGEAVCNRRISGLPRLRQEDCWERKPVR